jgi:hypothetical protein
MSTIKIKNSTTPSSVPSSASLSQGELAVNIADKKLFVGNASGDPVELTNQGVLSINGATGAITNVAFTNVAQTFTATQEFTAGISASGGTFASAIRVEGFVDVGLGGGGNSTNLMVGYQALDANTSGLNNLAVGFAALGSNTSGTSNTAVGASTLASNTTAGANVAIGSGSLQYSNSDNNTAIGHNSLNVLGFFGLGSGSNNTAIGFEAGRVDPSSNPILGFTGGVFIGYDARAGANNGTNEIVIGYEARGNGSNTTTIGNTSITDAYIYGLLHLPDGISAANLAFTNVDNNFSAGQTFDQGLQVTSNAPVTVSQQILATYTTNVVDVIASVDGIGLRIAQGTGGKNSGIGGIALGRHGTTANNNIIHNDTGVLTIYNAAVGTGNELFDISPTGNANFYVDLFAPNIVNSVNGATGDVTVSAIGFTYTASAPGSPAVGDRWMDADTGKEYIYINDGDSSQWIQPVSSNGLIGVTYDPNTETYEVDANVEIQGYVSSDTGFQITSGAINSQSGTTYTLLGSDNGKVIVWNTASSATLTVPSGLAVGYNTTLIQTGTGGIGITGSGTTLNSFEGKLTTAGQHAAVSLISYSSNVFNVAGGLTG